MAVTIDQLAQQIKAGGGQTYDRPGSAAAGPPPPPDSGGGGDIPPDVISRFIAGTATDQDLMLLQGAGLIDLMQAQTYAARRDSQQAKDSADPTAGLYPYDPRSGQFSPYPAESPIGNTAIEGGHAVRYYVDPASGIFYDANGKVLPQDLQRLLRGGGGGGGGQQAQIGYDYAALAQRAKEAEMQNALQQAQLRQSMLGNRASTGLSLGGLVQSLAQQQQNLAADPGNFPGYLAAQAGLPQGPGSPITQLLGSGVQIKPTTGANPLADPRFQNLLGEEYGYARPQSLQTVFDIMDRNGGKLPQAFYDYTHTQNPDQQQAAAYGKGGTQMLNEPVVGIGLKSKKPRFLAGEKGKEKLTFTPMKGEAQPAVPGAGRSATGGGPAMTSMPMNAMGGLGGAMGMMGAPRPLAGAFQSFGGGGGLLAGMNWGAFPAYGAGGFATAGPGSIPNARQWFPQIPMISFADGGAISTGGMDSADETANASGGMDTLTPAQGTAKAAGKAMEPYGWKWGTNTPYYLPQQLNAGNAPTPGSLDEFTFQNMPWSLQQLIGASVRSRLGQSGLNDWNSMLSRFQMPGLNSGYTNAIYQ